jgi:rRNA biogenesis protein RRP5
VGNDVTAYVRVSELSDSYLKEWKDSFQMDQLVKGRVTLVNPEQGKLQITLKESALDPNYKTPVRVGDLKVGQVVTGKVRKVEEFGAFIVIDRSANISGLCHRSEMAEKRVEDARTLYDEGDAVKAKIIKIDREQNKISFSLKASHFQDEDDEENDSSDEEDGVSIDGLGGVKVGDSDDEDEDDDDDASMGGLDLEDDSDEEGSDSDEDVPMKDSKPTNTGGLGATGFDWSGNVQNDESQAAASDSDEEQTKKKKKNRKPEIQVDRTGDLDANGPQSVADYERLLLGEPDSSLLWLQYMAFQLELGEVEKARAIAERALRTITMGQDAEKLNVWVALLNLENTYGNDDSLEDVFKRACQYNEPQEIYERMISIYIQSGKNEVCTDSFSPQTCSLRNSLLTINLYRKRMSSSGQLSRRRSPPNRPSSSSTSPPSSSTRWPHRSVAGLFCRAPSSPCQSTLTSRRPPSSDNWSSAPRTATWSAAAPCSRACYPRSPSALTCGTCF